MATSTVENYLKQLYLEQQRSAGELVSMGRLAEVMHVVPGTVTTMVKALADSGLVEYQPRGGVRLTPGGEQLALHVLRRHRLVELFLVEILGLDWSEVHEEAETLEHVISDKVLARLDEMLGHPIVDPHGDPIPSPQGTLTNRPLESLADCKAGRKVQIARVLDQDAEFLQFIDKRGLVPGISVTVEESDRNADAITVQLENDASVTLGTTAASKILVE